MRSAQPGATAGHSETKESTNDTNDGPTHSSGPVHRQTTPKTSAIATPAFPVVQRLERSPQANAEHNAFRRTWRCRRTLRDQEHKSDTTEGPECFSGPVHRYATPSTSAIAFHMVQRPEIPTCQRGTPCVPSHPVPPLASQRPKRAPATSPTVLLAPPPGPFTDRKHQTRVPSPLLCLPRCS